MLVLSRKLGEQVCIGTDITVTVLAVHGGNIRIGIDAPEQVPILRGELRQAPATADKRRLLGQRPS